MHRKISGCFQSEDHARHVAVIGSYLATARTHGLGGLGRLFRGDAWIPPRHHLTPTDPHLARRIERLPQPPPTSIHTFICPPPTATSARPPECPPLPVPPTTT